MSNTASFYDNLWFYFYAIGIFKMTSLSLVIYVQNMRPEYTDYKAIILTYL